MKQKYVILPILLIIACFSNAQEWVYSMDHAKTLAKVSHKLILVDFYADWCGPCRKMDTETWCKNEVKEVMKKIIPVKIDVDYNRALASRYGVNSIPSLFIIDAWGNVLWQDKGFKSAKRIENLLSNFPNHIKDLSDPLMLLEEDRKNAELHFNVALGYQNYALQSEGQGKDIFIRKSESYFNTAKNFYRKKRDSAALERIKIMKCFNGIIMGRSKSAIKELEKTEFEKMEESNKALACFVMVNGFMELEDFKNASIYRKKLKLIEENSFYMEELKKYYPGILGR